MAPFSLFEALLRRFRSSTLRRVVCDGCDSVLAWPLRDYDFCEKYDNDMIKAGAYSTRARFTVSAIRIGAGRHSSPC